MRPLSGSMEAAGATEILNRSITKDNLFYHEYLGDGDTSSYKDVFDSKPYVDYSIIPEKLEFVGMSRNDWELDCIRK